MRYRFLIEGETPAKKNSRRTLRNGKTIPSVRFMQWHNDASFQVMCQKRPAKPIERPAAVDMVFYHGDCTRRDSDNAATSILDLLKDTLVIADDNWKIIRQINIVNRYDRNNARCEITLTDYKGKE